MSERLLRPHVEIPTNVFVHGTYGYGLFGHDDDGARMVEHGGQLPGYSSEMKMLPEQRAAVIILNNRDGVRLHKSFAKAFALLLPPHERRAPAPSDPPKLPLAMDPSEMARYVGTYGNRWEIDVSLRDGKLYLKQFDTELPITRIGENRFSVTPQGAPSPREFLLVPAADGKPSYLQMALWVFRRVETGERGAAK